MLLNWELFEKSDCVYFFKKIWPPNLPWSWFLGRWNEVEVVEMKRSKQFWIYIKGKTLEIADGLDVTDERNISR